MNRREFIKSTVVTAAVTGAAINLPGSILAAEDAEEKKSIVAAVRGDDTVKMFRKGIDALGGIGKFVKDGQTVVVKPNIAWDRTPEFAANTNPELVAEVVKQCIAAGAKKVYVLDHTCNAWKPCYKNSGIEDAAKEAGAEVLAADKVEFYTDVESPKGIKMKNAKVLKVIMECDVFINIPILKNHGGARMTSAMKNLMGIVWDRGFMHKNDLSQCIADSILFRKPDLNIVDAYRIMTANGPRGATLNDVKLLKYQLLSTDIVAVDTLSAKLIGYPLERLPYITMGEKHGLGVSDEAKMDIKRIEA